jgi:hypothetical protein
MIQPRFPIYIPSYDRWQDDRHPTMDALDEMGVSYTIVVRKEEYDKYVKVFGEEKVIVVSEEFLDNYETCDDLGRTKSVGSGAQRNFGGEDSRKKGHKYHWIMDDNIQGFYRYHNNRQIKLNSGAFFRIMENFVLKYKNIGMAGPNYKLFMPRKAKCRPLTFNTRIYSCNLIRNDVPFRWRGRYNEDTILSIDMLKAGWCTVLFNTLLQNKTPTQLTKGGNTKVLYGKGTYAKSLLLKNTHPDITEVKIKFHRWHHEVDYRIFKKMKLKPEDKDKIPKDAYEEFKFKLKKNG